MWSQLLSTSGGVRVAMAVKNADRQFIPEFIEVYRSLPALWDVKCKDYTNRGKKNEQYDVLIEKYRENVPDADKQEVIKKINSSRTNFRKELKRIQDAEKSGAGAEDVEPSLWYFEEMRFLQNQEAPTASTSSMNPVLDSGPEDAWNEDSDKTNDGRATSESNVSSLFLICIYFYVQLHDIVNTNHQVIKVGATGTVHFTS